MCNVRFLCAIVGFLFITSCSNMSNQDTGLVSGGIIGGLVGSAFGGAEGKALAIAAGTLVGAVIGGRIGRSMDELDRLKLAQTLESTKKDHSKTWVNPDTKAKYTVTPIKTYTEVIKRKERPCREFVTEAIIGGQKEKIYGKACRMDDGSWQMIN